VFAADASGKISLTFLNNASTLPGHFELDDRQVASARQKIRAAGKRPIGIFTRTQFQRQFRVRQMCSSHPITRLC